MDMIFFDNKLDYYYYYYFFHQLIIHSVRDNNRKRYFFMYAIQHCFICRPSDFTVSDDARIEPRTVVTLALTALWL